MKDEIILAKQNEAYHRKKMEYFQEEIKILEGNSPTADTKEEQIKDELYKGLECIEPQKGESK